IVRELVRDQRARAHGRLADHAQAPCRSVAGGGRGELRHTRGLGPRRLGDQKNQEDGCGPQKVAVHRSLLRQPGSACALDLRLSPPQQEINLGEGSLWRTTRSGCRAHTTKVQRGDQKSLDRFRSQQTPYALRIVAVEGGLLLGDDGSSGL